VEKLQARREKLCKQYMDKIKTPNHLLNALLPHPCNREHDYSSETTIIGTFIPLIIDRIVGQSYVVISLLINTIKRQFFSMSRICNEKCSKPKIFLAFLSKLLCFSFILSSL
jgi:hypothetical protein